MTGSEPSEMSMTSPNSAADDARDRLNQITARAAAKDAVKDFNTAAELYSQATELQAELNGELSPENADLLFAYGKALYNVAVSKSDVLGSKVAGQPQAESSSASVPTGNITSAESTSASESLVQNAIASGMTKKGSENNEKPESDATQNKPYFQFTGDENFDESDEDEDDEKDGEEEDEDDFANAFEVLDLARILSLKKLETAEESNKGKSAEMPPDIRAIKERVADTYDLQAEISLEAERFTDAVSDLRTALELRQSLHPFEDSSIAECHYKLSLALEFASVNKPAEDTGEDEQGTVDEGMRKEALTQMESAIESCKIRMTQEQKKLDEGKTMNEDQTTAAKRQIANVKEIVAEMEQRLIDLRRPPVSMKEEDQKNEAVLRGILGQVAGQSSAEQNAKLDAVSQGANDLSAFVKRKPAPGKSSGQGNPTQSAPKRSAEGGQEGDSKRARMDGPSQS